MGLRRRPLTISVVALLALATAASAIKVTQALVFESSCSIREIAVSTISLGERSPFATAADCSDNDICQISVT